jgi:hypothetical protein
VGGAVSATVTGAKVRGTVTGGSVVGGAVFGTVVGGGVVRVTGGTVEVDAVDEVVNGMSGSVDTTVDALS